MIDNMFKLIEEFDTITIFGHIRPDGDCLGSQFGMKELILENYPNKNVYVVGESSATLAFIGDVDKVEDRIIRESLAIIVDTATNERISDKRVFQAKKIIKFDHHRSTEDIGEYVYLEDHVSSCAEIIANIAYERNLKVNSICANSLYTGILTDSNCFRYDGVTPRTLRLAAFLVENGADLVELNKTISMISFNSLSFKGYVIENMKKTDMGFVYCYLSQKAMEEYNVSYEEAGMQVSTLANIIGCPIWALFIEAKDEVRIRLRSNGPRIDLLANKYDGGGHMLASGAKLSSKKDIYKFTVDADEVIREYRLNNQ